MFFICISFDIFGHLIAKKTKKKTQSYLHFPLDLHIIRFGFGFGFRCCNCRRASLIFWFCFWAYYGFKLPCFFAVIIWFIGVWYVCYSWEQDYHCAGESGHCCKPIKANTPCTISISLTRLPDMVYIHLQSAAQCDAIWCTGRASFWPTSAVYIHIYIRYSSPPLLPILPLSLFPAE